MKKNLYGHVYDKNGQPLRDAMVCLKDDCFETLQETLTDKEGAYRLCVEQQTYPFLFVVKDYAERYLEFWGSNIVITEDTQIDARIDTLELYGLNCFQIRGGSDRATLSVYFRPMSLDKYKKNEADICPNIDQTSMRVWINDEACDLLVVNEVREYASNHHLRAYLLEVSMPEALQVEARNVLRVQIRDKDTAALGEAVRYF